MNRVPPIQMNQPIRNQSIHCTKCEAASQLYLCELCIVTLRRQLLGMPILVDRVHDAAVGQTRLGEHGRHVRGHNSGVRFSGKASDLLDDIGDTIGRWARALSRQHGFVTSPPVTWHRPVSEYRPTTADYALFLAAHVRALANDPDVVELHDALRRYIRQALVLINRPVPPQFCGACPAQVTDHHNCPPDCHRGPHDCGTRLMARRGAVEIVCPSCKTTHNVEKLVNHLLARADAFRATLAEMYRVMRMLGEPVTVKQLQHWARQGWIKPRGYLRADKRSIGITRRDGDTPVYRVSEVRKVRAGMPERRKAQAQAAAERRWRRNGVKGPGELL